jgi:hypothetical protein
MDRYADQDEVADMAKYQTVEEYAVGLVADGARSFAEDDLNEDGEIAEVLHDDAVELALDLARAIGGHRAEFIAWARQMGEIL